MPIIHFDKGIQLMVPKEDIELMENSQKLTEELVHFLNSKTDDYAEGALALTFATLFFLRTIRSFDDKLSEETRSKMLEIISEGR